MAVTTIKRLTVALLLIALTFFLFPENVSAEKISACDLAFVDCWNNSGGWWFFKAGCLAGWAWCVIYIEAPGYA